MPRHSDKSVEEIVEEASTTMEVMEEPEEELEDAEVMEVQPSDNPLRYVDPNTIEFYPDIKKAKEEAQIPEHIAAKNLVDRPFLLYSKRPQKAALPDTGELRDGFFCTCVDMETKKPFTTWLGQVALVRDLSQLSPPFRVTIVKHGRTYRFE